MEDTKERFSNAANEVCDAVRFLGDVTYAILPHDTAHALGDLKKSFWTNVRSFSDWELNWIDERIAGGDRLREEWKEKCKRAAETSAEEPAEPTN